MSKARKTLIAIFMWTLSTAGVIFIGMGAANPRTEWVMSGMGLVTAGFVLAAVLELVRIAENKTSRVTFSYKLPDEEQEMLLAVNGHRYWRTLWELKEELFYLLDEDVPNDRFKDPQECVEHIHSRLLEIADDKSVKWDEIE